MNNPPHFPTDYITLSLSTWWNYEEVSVGAVLSRLEKLKACYPKMQRIWEHSTTGLAGNNRDIRNCLKYYDTVLKKLRTGELHRRSVYIPEFVAIPDQPGTMWL